MPAARAPRPVPPSTAIEPDIAPATPRRTRKAPASAPRPYHHGALPEAVLAAAEVVLVRDGIAGLGLRAIAREAGVSHTAPKHHFGDTAGLLGELAAVGFYRLGAAMQAAGQAAAEGRPRRKAVAAAYVRFAHENPALFGLMFRTELVDMRRPTLASAIGTAMRMLVPTVGGEAGLPGTGDTAAPQAPLTLERADAMRVTAAWAYVHGLATLLIDQRLRGIVKAAPDFADPAALVAAVLHDIDLGLDFPAKTRGHHHPG